MHGILALAWALPASGRDARIPFFNICILSVSVKNYPYPYPIRLDVVNCYPYPIRIHGSIMLQLHRKSKTFSFKLCRCWWRFL